MRLINKLRSIRKKKNNKRKFDQDDAKHPTRLPSYLKKKYYKKGFFAINIINYELEKNNYKDYVTDWDRLIKMKKENHKYKFVIKDKLIFHNYFKGNPKIIQPLGFISKGQIIDFQTTQMTSVERIFENLDEDIIIKPSRGGRGLGIIKVQAREREEAISSLQKISRQGNVFVIQKKLKQSGFCHKVNPQAVNTIRILTMRDPDKGEPFIAQAVQRFGSESTGYLDNWSAGGLSVDIDLDKGVYKKGATRSSMKGLNWLSRHPDSDIKFEGIAVENWEEIKKGVLELSKELFFIP